MKRLLLASTCIVVSACFGMGSAQVWAADAVVSVTFTETPAPSTEQDMTRAYTASEAVVTYRSGTSKRFPLSYVPLFKSGDKGAGRIVDKTGALIRNIPAEDGSNIPGPFYAYAPDANSLIASKNGLHLVTHFEYETEAKTQAGKPVNMYRQLPMTMTLTDLTQDASTGALKVRKINGIDFALVDGLWVPCAGTLTPWNTHLGGEEYEPNARYYETRPLEVMNLYLKTPGKTARQGGANPYSYGHLVEVAVTGGKPKVTKHYAAGRLAFELADVQEDGRTLYYGDDGRDVVRFMFVADRVGDLSSGTLYAAKWIQTDAAGGGKANLKWINLGHATNAEIEALVSKGIQFSDIFESAESPAPTFTSIYVYLGAEDKDRSALEHLKVKPGMEKAAAFLESRRYAAIKGATTEFTKMEGITHDPESRIQYTAMSYVERAMLDGKNEARPQDDIKLSGNPKDLVCGVVYASAMRGGQYDTEGQYIPSDWVAVDMHAQIMGQVAKAGTQYDSCDTDKVANPDNIKYSPAMRTLFIGEDSGNHLNNFLWAYNVDTHALTRILSAPIGAENTGLAVAENVKGYAYILSNIQHPGAAEDLDKYPDDIKVRMRAKVDQRGSVGYLQGLPAVK